MKASWGEGFKLPSFFALGEPNVGNTQLKPERSRSFDIGLEKRMVKPELFLSLIYFQNSFRDLIDFSPEQFRLVNRSLAVTQGVEFEVNFAATKRLQLGGHLTFLKADLRGVEEPLRDRPRWRGGASLTWQATNLIYFRVESLWVGSRFDFQVPVSDRQTVGGY